MLHPFAGGLSVRRTKTCRKEWRNPPADNLIGSISLVLRVPEHVIFSSSHFFFFGVECSISFFIFLFCVCFNSVCFFCNFFLSWERQGYTSFALYLDITISRHCIFNNYSTSTRWIGVGYNHLISNKREWHNCFIKNAHKISRILPNVIYKNNRFSTSF